MTLKVLYDPVGFAADCLTLANALGYSTPQQAKPFNDILHALCDVSDSLEEVKRYITASTNDSRGVVETTAVMLLQSQFRGTTKFNSLQLSTLIKLILLIKHTALNVVFALIVRYKVGSRTATLGFSAHSADDVSDLVLKIDAFCRALRVVSFEKTCYITTRIRGRFDCIVENRCTAALTAIATEVCDLSRNVTLENVLDSKMKARGDCTIALLHPSHSPTQCSEYDRLCRVFIIGDTRSGKSVLGNALLEANVFTVSKGTTGTLNIQRGEYVRSSGGEIHVMEVLDTPGLNDNNGLDTLYEAAIVDKIRALHRCSSLVMLIDVQAGPNNSMRRALQQYKAIFGESMVSMLVIILTLNEPASMDELNECKTLNWPTVSTLDTDLSENNVYCLSIHDLRTQSNSVSHDILRDVRRHCFSMPMTFIQSMRTQYYNIFESLKRRNSRIQLDLRQVLDDGWMAYDLLTEKFESSPYVKLTEGLFEGFVMKYTSFRTRLTSLLSVGVINLNRKVAIRVRAQNDRGRRAWRTFLTTYSSDRSNMNLMRTLGDHLDKMNLGVFVLETGTSRVASFSVKRYSVSIIDPTARAHEQLFEYLHELLNGTNV